MHTLRPSHPAHGAAKKPSTGDRKQKFDSNCNFFAIGNCCEPSDRGPRYKTAGNPPLSGRFRFTRLKNEPLIAKKLQRCRNFCFHDGRIATTGTRPYEKRVKSPSKGKRAYPKSKKAKPHEPARLTGQTMRKRRVLATAAGQNPRNSHESQRGQEGPRKNHTTPPSNGGGANLTKEGLQNKGVRKKKREGLQYRYGAARKKVRRGFGGPFQERIHYASEASHSTMQLFRNGLESGASALTIRNFASPSAVFQTSVRKRTPGRTGEVKRHLKRVIASG